MLVLNSVSPVSLSEQSSENVDKLSRFVLRSKSLHKIVNQDNLFSKQGVYLLPQREVYSE